MAALGFLFYCGQELFNRDTKAGETGDFLSMLLSNGTMRHTMACEDRRDHDAAIFHRAEALFSPTGYKGCDIILPVCLANSENMTYISG